MISERTRPGIEAAKQADKHTGHLPSASTLTTAISHPTRITTPLSPSSNALRGGESKRSTAKYAGVSRSTVGRIIERVDLYREHGGDGVIGAVAESAAGD